MPVLCTCNPCNLDDFDHCYIEELTGDHHPDAERLLVESFQLLHDIAPVVSEALQLDMISLRVRVAHARDPHTLLLAYARLVLHAQKLDAFPDAKTAFWLTMATSMVGWEFQQLCSQYFGMRAFPGFTIDCGLQWMYGKSTLDESMFRAIDAWLMMTPAPSPTWAPPVPITLSFASNSLVRVLTQAQLKTIESMLDRIATHTATLAFTVRAVDFSGNVMESAELAVVARIVAKCRSGFYAIEQITVDAVVPDLGTSTHKSDTSELSRELLEIMAAAFRLETNPLSSLKRSTPPASADASVGLRTVSLSMNNLPSTIFRAHFSTLRYGCPVQEDRTQYTTHRYPHRHKEMSVDVWRWLAFGLFYPRPQRFASQYKLRSIGKLAITPLAIRTIVDTLRNPVAQLVNNGVEGTDTTATDSLMVCTVKKGARIQLLLFTDVRGASLAVDDTFSPTNPRWETLLETSELEALCEKDDGSVCVVVPGAGLGWVAKAFVVAIGREPLELARSAQNGLYCAAISTDGCPVDDLRPFFQAIGHQFHALTVDFGRPAGCGPTPAYPVPVQDTVVQCIRDHCVHLRDLNLNDASADEMSALLDALSHSSLRYRLRKLDLSSNPRCVNEATAARLAAILADARNPPVMQELRFSWIGEAGLASFHDALLVNRALAVLALSGLRDTSYPAARDRLDAAFQGQVLRPFSPMETKLAFLSVVDKQRSSACHWLNDRVLSHIFQFAANLETRRVIAWYEDFAQGDQPY